MAIRLTDEPSLPYYPLALSFDTLEALVNHAENLDLKFSVDKQMRYGYRYSLTFKQASGANFVETAVNSNDIGDIARYLGMAADLTEPGFPLADAMPTVVRMHTVDPVKGRELTEEVTGRVAFRAQCEPVPAVGTPMLRNERGELDHTSDVFKRRAWVLYLLNKTDALFCRKALLQADGDATAAMSLILLDQYRSEAGIRRPGTI